MLEPSCRRHPERDVLDVACDRIWGEIRRLLPRHRYLHDLGASRSADQRRELSEMTSRLARLKRRSERYREVLRNEAWARWDELSTAPLGGFDVGLDLDDEDTLGAEDGLFGARRG